MNAASAHYHVDVATAPAPLRVVVELPAEAARSDARPATVVATGLRLLWILDRVRAGRVSIGKAAELAGIDRWAFMRLIGEHGIPVINHPVEDVAKDLDTLRAL